MGLNNWSKQWDSKLIKNVGGPSVVVPGREPWSPVNLKNSYARRYPPYRRGMPPSAIVPYLREAAHVGGLGSISTKLGFSGKCQFRFFRYLKTIFSGGKAEKKNFTAEKSICTFCGKNRRVLGEN